jgi:hypothetical protein
VAPSLFMFELSKNNGDTIEYNHVSICFYVHCFLQKHCRGDKLDPSECSQIDSSALSMGAVM